LTFLNVLFAPYANVNLEMNVKTWL